jgi:hypothetical protein
MAQDDEETCLRVNSRVEVFKFVCQKILIYLVESSANIKIYLQSAKYLLIKIQSAGATRKSGNN